MKKITNQELIKRTKNKYVKFPSQLCFEKYRNDAVIIHMENNAVLMNLQSDDACFEAWALIIKRWFPEIKHIHVSFPEPFFHFLTATEKEHYQRFLFRINRFNEIFDWFGIDVHNIHCLYQLVFEEKGKYVLNPPDKKRRRDKNIIQSTNIRESELETLIVSNDKIKKDLCKISGAEILDNQLPVGVFKDIKKKAARIFTGGKSAIDIWGLDKSNKTLFIFELKNSNNKKVGIISELFFYSLVMKEMQKKTFTYEKVISPLDKLIKTNKIKAFTLTPELHPLIDKELFDIINDGLKKAKENIEFEIIEIKENVSFQKVK